MPDVSTISEFYAQPSFRREVYDEMVKNGWDRESGDVLIEMLYSLTLSSPKAKLLRCAKSPQRSSSAIRQ